MSPAIINPSKRLPTRRTRIRPIPKMASLMTPQVDIPREALPTNGTRKLPRNLSTAQNFEMRARLAQGRVVDVNMTISILVAHETQRCRVA
jgi:hypothetical protein